MQPILPKPATPAGERGVGLGALQFLNVPGGAGHVQELLEHGTEWLEQARRTPYVDPAHDARCKSACLDCLLSFDTQTASSHDRLDRRRAPQVLDDLLAGQRANHDDVQPPSAMTMAC